MTKQDAEFWNKARRARDKLEKKYINYPDVSLIDIGYPPEQDEATGTIVLRIHVRERWMQAKSQKRPSFPKAIDGIPVVLIPGDYDLSSDSQ